MELQDKINNLMQQIVVDAEAKMGPALIQKAKNYFKGNTDGYFEWLNYCSTIKSVKPDISDDEFAPDKFEIVQVMLGKRKP